MGRIIGLDVGERRMGVAISTPERTLAVPLRVLDVAEDAAAAAEVSAIARAEGVDLLVVGHPISLSGAPGPQALRVELFARLLGEASGLRVELWDERLSSVQARRLQPKAKKGRKRPAPIDDIAASIVLQSYLDHLAATA